jgi:hypothetical protein
MWIRLILSGAGAVATLFVARDSQNFTLIAGMVAVVLIAVVVLVLALGRRR